ncbi:recombinase family protein [Tropicimonas sp. IMCC6043]|uniref:recombinase family protein n=1 Tax=Tropicimonas sp. IMCC6043 TaxID=2510645 RepID=UPI00101B7C61|nr:recombinase family protein [Tropicimonas sp. IMCC6043]RYH06259.1 recombinase family protein [Tropicimonas sp. IMCC6043]
MSKPRIRCAIYTRKSSDEGLDQDFNSLDAQHEACAAYIASQRHEGWKMLPARYDDGGISGGTLDRPGLQRLLADIDAGRIDMVVVYKIDRLTRSLADFAKLVERLEEKDCSFVSVTQAFNTSSSMGRLTLNVLLSFAQFEREVTAERIRDKIAASKKKGLWMGGVPPLGYDPHPDPMRRELVVNEAEAEVVRQLFTLYATHRCLNLVTQKAEGLGLRSKRHVFSTGREQGGNVLSRGQIHKILTNPVYLGQIRHKEKAFPGKHPAIIDQPLWDQVQNQLQAASARRRGVPAGQPSSDAAPLKGKFQDESGDFLTPTHARKNGKQLRYYISNRLVSGGTDPTGWRLPAPGFETSVASLIADHLAEHASRHAVLCCNDALQSVAASEAVERLAHKIRSDGIRDATTLITDGSLGNGRITIELDADAIALSTGLSADDLNRNLLKIDRPFTCRRRGVEMKILAGNIAPAPDAAMIRALRNAHRWSESLKAGTPLNHLAAEVNTSERYLARVTALAGLSPKIQVAIVNGTQPVDLTLKRLLRNSLPLEWNAQEHALGFGV